MEELDWKLFLETSPPGRQSRVTGALRRQQGARDTIIVPDLWLDCDTQQCNGDRWFTRTDKYDRFAPAEENSITFELEYVCRNCRSKVIIFSALLFRKSGDLLTGVKIGQWPPFGPRTPAELITLIGPDREVFLKGRRAESQGMGIGAFAYYRRVVENQKNRLFDEMMRVATATGASKEILEGLSNAKVETQFTRAIELVKPGIPDALKIDGHNPLTLLHDALSNGIHGLSDEECLEKATAIRVLLTRLAQRAKELLRDESELKTALSKLINKPAKETKKKESADPNN